MKLPRTYKFSAPNAAMTFGEGMLRKGAGLAAGKQPAATFSSEISTGGSSKTSSESSSSRAVAVLSKCFDSVVIDFRRVTLTIKKSPEIRAFSVDSVASSAVLNNLRQASGESGKREGPTDSDPRLQSPVRQHQALVRTARRLSAETLTPIPLGVTAELTCFKADEGR